MSVNDRHAEALAVLRQDGVIPADHPDVREAVMDWLEAGEEGWALGPSRALSLAIRDHNPHIDPYADVSEVTETVTYDGFGASIVHETTHVSKDPEGNRS